MRSYSKIEVIAFDADDTLWVNETFFRDAEDEFCTLMVGYETENKARQELIKYEMQNLAIYGYGIKGFVLSMMECALELSNQNLNPEVSRRILEIGKEMLHKPVDLLDGVRETLEAVSKKHRVLLLTKGDLLDQERKLEKSGLSEFFHHVEVLSNKLPKNYKELLDHLSVDPATFLMIGNSLKSDILPVLELGGMAIHVPFHTTWDHEKVENPPTDKYQTLSRLDQVINLL